MSNIAVVNPSQNASLFAPWAESFDGNALLRTIGLIILIVYGIFQAISLCFECFRDARAEAPNALLSADGFQLPPPEAMNPVQDFRPIEVNDGNAQDGAQLFQEIIEKAMETLPNTKEKDDLRDLFIGVDPGLVEFVFSSIAYQYAFGSKKDGEIPDFLKNDSFMAIRRLRRRVQVAAEREKTETGKNKGKAREELQQLEKGIPHLPEIFKNPTNFNLAQKDPAIWMTLAKIKAIASGELRGGVLFVIWQQAAEAMEASLKTQK